MLFTLSLFIILIPLLQLLLETVGVEGPITEHMEDCLDSVSSLAFSSLQGSVFTQGRGNWQAWQFQSISSSAAIYASQVGCRKTNAKNAIIVGKSTEESLSVIIHSCCSHLGSEENLGCFLYTVLRMHVPHLGKIYLYRYTLLSLSLKFLRTEASYSSVYPIFSGWYSVVFIKC